FRLLTPRIANQSARTDMWVALAGTNWRVSLDEPSPPGKYSPYHSPLAPVNRAVSKFWRGSSSAIRRGRANVNCPTIGLATSRNDVIILLVIVAVDAGTTTLASFKCGSVIVADWDTHSRNRYGPDSGSAGAGPAN